MDKFIACSVLNLPLSYTEVELKKAYRAASKQAHPDLGGTAEDFKRVKEAHDFLSKLPIITEVGLTHRSIFIITKK